MLATRQVLVDYSLHLNPAFLMRISREKLTKNDYLMTVHCSMLAEDAIKSAISNYYTKNPHAVSTDLSGTGSTIPGPETVDSRAQQQASLV